MLALSLVATVVALAIAAVAIGHVLERFVTGGIDRRLDAELALLTTAIGPDGVVDDVRLVQVRGALDAGPGWTWRIATPQRKIGAAMLADLTPPPRPWPDDSRIGGPRPLDGRADGEPVHARRLTIAGAAGDVELTAAAPRAVIVRPIRAAMLPLLGTLAALAGLLVAATLVQLRIGLGPLRRMRAQVAAIRSGAIVAIDPDQPDELQPLANELNALLQENAAVLASARTASANLAHALKTPVATLALTLRHDSDAARLVGRIDATIRRHLSRARGTKGRVHAATPLAAAVAAIVDTVAALHRDRAVAIDAQIPPDMRIAVDRDDLDEIIGNLIDNAARHARTRVALVALPDARWARITVSDDGPGIPASLRAHATELGTRLDERGDGHGFGLAIVRELAMLYGGALAIDDADGGGTAATVTLPRSSGR